MKKRFLGMVTAGILATVMLAGCGASASKVTAESLLQEVQSKCDAMKSLETHTTAEITLESDALGGTMDLTMDMTMQTTIEPVANYLKGNISIPGLGTAMDMENYTVVQDDQILSAYNYIDFFFKIEISELNGFTIHLFKIGMNVLFLSIHF